MNTKISFEELAVLGAKALSTQEPISYEKALLQVWKLKIMSYLRSMELEESNIREVFEKLFFNDPGYRRVKIYTGPGGMDIFDEAMQGRIGYKRIYISKVPRILKSRNFKRAYTDRWYKYVKL